MAAGDLSSQIRYRILQGLRHLTHRPNQETDAALRALLTPRQWQLMVRLSPADRAHLLKVQRELLRHGFTDRDLLLAALLHDIGKADQRGTVTMIHRVIKVGMSLIAPQRLRQLSEENEGWLAHGLYLALNHAALGADLVRQTGANERTCWLIAHHDDDTILGDDELTALQAIDAKE